MSAYLEVMIEGNCRAFLKADSVMGIITSSGMTGDTAGTPDAPISLVLSGGNTLSGVYGISPNRLIIHAAGAKLLEREEGRLSVVAYLDNQDEFEAKVAHYLEARRGQAR